jgi:peptidoglycan/LPS O-acetylase OafA/YrhL
MSRRLGYVPALDGLRGIAIAAVVGYHFFDLPGGIYGVDLFFVLSGFLITTLLLEEHASAGTVSLRNFYERRARRLLPALAPVLMFSLLVGTLNMEAGQRTAALVRFKAVAACALYSANIVHLLGHLLPIEVSPMWSLAQEEQFYFVWPVLLLLLLRRRVTPSQLMVGLIGFACCVTAWRAFLALHGHESRVFFGPDTHCDGLALGAALAAARAAGWNIGRRLLVPFLVVFLALVALPISQRTQYAYGLTVVVVASAGLIASAPTSRLLAWPPLVWLGSISYGLYLWQGPVLLLGGHGVVPAAIAVMLGYASTRWVEKPFRKRHRQPTLAPVGQARPSTQRT